MTIAAALRIGRPALLCLGLLALGWPVPSADGHSLRARFTPQELEPLPVALTFPAVVVTAMCGIALRLYMLSSVALAHRAAGAQFRRLFPVVLVIDALWAASPLLAASQITIGVALIGVAGMAYTPFSQRTLMRRLYPTQVPEL